MIDVGEYLEKFSIELKYIPTHLHFLMRVIGWLDEDTYAPTKHLSGFCSTSYHDYSTKYLATNLLFIDCELRERYKPQELAA